MKIEVVDFFYLSMPEVRDIGDGSQDALLVRVRSDDGHEGWGECEAAPLPSIAAWCCPMSHSACKPVSHSIVGQRVEAPDDIRRLNREVRRNSFDLLQADHTLSGVDMALWDLLGRRTGEPVWSLLGWGESFPKVAYASQLFGDTPAETGAKARRVRAAGFQAAKFGWGPFGQDLAMDEAHVREARAGLGDGVLLLVDAGTVWGEVQRRLHAMDPAVYRAWFQALTTVEMVGGRLILAAPSPFHASYVSGQMSHRLLAAVREIDPSVSAVSVTG